MRRFRIRIRKRLLILPIIIFLFFAYSNFSTLAITAHPEFAQSAASSFFNQAILTCSEIIDKTISHNHEESSNYSDMSVDISELISLKRKITDYLDKSTDGSFTSMIPLGSFTELPNFSAFGPKIPIVFYFSGSIKTEISDTIISSCAGQSLYRIKLSISADIYCVNNKSHYSFTADLPVYESVIVSRITPFYSQIQDE